MIELYHKNLSVRYQCKLLGVNRSVIYYREKVPVDESEIMNRIHEIWLKFPVYGYRRLTKSLQDEGYDINRKRVYRLMKLMNLEAIYCKPNLSKSHPNHEIYPYLLKGLIIDRPNQVWCTDITYLKMPQGFVYLVAIIDVYSRYIVSWRLSTSLDASFCLDMLGSALSVGVPEILNTDQGCQFTSIDWIKMVTGSGAKVSMDGKGRWADNIPIERFWRTLKHENVFLNAYETVADVRQGLKSFIESYNEERLHSSIGYTKPGLVYRGEETAPSYFLGKFIKKTAYPVESVENTSSLVANDSPGTCLPHTPQDQQQPQQPFYNRRRIQKTAHNS
jgi:putative transposase